MTSLGVDGSLVLGLVVVDVEEVEAVDVEEVEAVAVEVVEGSWVRHGVKSDRGKSHCVPKLSMPSKSYHTQKVTLRP